MTGSRIKQAARPHPVSRVRRLFLTGLWLAVGAMTVSAEEVEGILHWARRVELGMPVSGVVAEVPVRASERVARGQVLVRLDPRPFQARVDKARAELEGLMPAREEAEREWERARELYERTVLSNHELEQARIGFVTADTRYQAARMRLRLAELDLEYSVLRAPFAAVVLERRVETGQAVVARLRAETLVVLAEAGRMVARVFLPAERIARLEVGERATVDVGGLRFEGRITRLGLEPAGGRNDVPRYPVDVTFAFDDSYRPRAGQRAVVELP